MGPLKSVDNENSYLKTDFLQEIDFRHNIENNEL